MVDFRLALLQHMTFFMLVLPAIGAVAAASAAAPQIRCCGCEQLRCCLLATHLIDWQKIENHACRHHHMHACNGLALR